jgi:hypothetical protein
VYLVGGTALVFEGLRSESLDMDIVWDVENRDCAAFVRAVQELKHELGLNVEEASPADFIPLPSGHLDRCKFIGRYGNLDVFHYDLYSTALSKVSRGTDEDLADVVRLLEAGHIQWEKLEACFNEILPAYATRSLKQDPEGFRTNFRALRALWQEL